MQKNFQTVGTAQNFNRKIAEKVIIQTNIYMIALSSVLVQTLKYKVPVLN
jgi:hypothetical protein